MEQTIGSVICLLSVTCLVYSARVSTEDVETSNICSRFSGAVNNVRQVHSCWLMDDVTLRHLKSSETSSCYHAH